MTSPDTEPSRPRGNHPGPPPIDPRWLRRMQQRAAVYRAIRHFFDAADFVEVDTPVALTAPAPELHIEAPGVQLHAGEQLQQRFLQPSPELPMKRLLAAGLPKIYQLAAVFRDGDLGPIHRPEFRLLEWYRRDAPWTRLLDDCEGLLRACAAAAGCGQPLTHHGQSIDLHAPFRRLSVDEAFRQHAGFSILDTLQWQPLAAQLQRLRLPYAADDGWDDLFHRVFLSVVEPALLEDPQPLFLTHYPAPLASLARLDPNDSRVSERFELYAGGMELANGFGELTDADEQQRRFAADARARQQRGMNAYPLDKAFLTSLGHIDSAAGIALGVERLLLLLLDADDIDAISFIAWSQS